MKILATDLDRTLIPNGKQKYDSSLSLFKHLVKQNKIKLIYVTGRNLKLTNEAIKNYYLPKPDYLIANVGSRIYKYKNKKLITDKKWFNYLNKKTKTWDIKKFKKILKEVPGLKIQEKEKQDKYKLSYYVNLKKEKDILKKIKLDLGKISQDVKIIYSHDYPKKRGLLDILPKNATKIGAINFLVKELKIPKENIICAGDSGNDLQMLTSDYKTIIVKNANKKLKREIKKIRRSKQTIRNLYIAKNKKIGKLKLNGNYVSGIIQGLVYFRFVNKKGVF